MTVGERDERIELLVKYFFIVFFSFLKLVGGDLVFVFKYLIELNVWGIRFIFVNFFLIILFGFFICVVFNEVNMLNIYKDKKEKYFLNGGFF